MRNMDRSRRRLRNGLAAALLVATGGAALATPPAPAVIDLGAVQGDWRNLKNSVHIRTYACGAELCGVITWANAKASADAAKGGTAKLEGTQVFREFRPIGDGAYKGKVFVPDIKRTFAGRLQVTADDKLVGKGCVLGGLICKTSTWVRVN